MEGFGSSDNSFFSEMGRRRVQARGLTPNRPPMGSGGFVPPRGPAPVGPKGTAPLPRPRPMGGTPPPPRAPGGGMGSMYQQQMARANNPTNSFGNSADVYHWMEMGGRPGYDPSHMYLGGPVL